MTATVTYIVFAFVGEFEAVEPPLEDNIFVPVEGAGVISAEGNIVGKKLGEFVAVGANVTTVGDGVSRTVGREDGR
jgi:hypothetical protein